jgi:hypothetical protein
MAARFRSVIRTPTRYAWLALAIVAGTSAAVWGGVATVDGRDCKPDVTIGAHAALDAGLRYQLEAGQALADSDRDDLDPVITSTLPPPALTAGGVVATLEVRPYRTARKCFFPVRAPPVPAPVV